MGTLSRVVVVVSSLAVPLFAGPVGHGSHGVRSGPGLPPASGTHLPFVGDQNWGPSHGPYGVGRPGTGFNNGWNGGWNNGWNGGRHHRYPGVFAFPFFPVTDWSGYLGDSNPYYEAPPPDAYGPSPYVSMPAAAQQAYFAPPPPEPPPTPAVAAPQDPPQPLPPVIVVLQNGQKLQVTNYAIVDDVLWDFSKPAAHKIRVATIDLAASAKATEDSGGEFPQLSAPNQTH